MLGTGYWPNLAEVIKCLRRIETLTRMINLREGVIEDLNALPHRLLNESSTKGPSRGFKSFVNKEDFQRSVEEYYRQMGWNEFGIPQTSTINELSLTEM